MLYEVITCYHHVAYESIPSRESVIEIIERFREILFPGYFSSEKLDPVNLKYNMGRSISMLFDLLAEQICVITSYSIHYTKLYEAFQFRAQW